ncbi:N-acetylmuramoyl-L-alanine amidase [Spongisporangium articulatum]|uniref:N-acetylmuramoyl-L-alanine amidase n=1 Tax=Spongisporangium articulatum TaxID=3362603 RepID=A0ABW8AK48_9ACTN
MVTRPGAGLLPKVAERPLRFGDRGPAVVVLRDLLDRAELGQPDEGAAPLSQAPDVQLFDEAVQEAVRLFQQFRGVLADGVVGRDTALQLDAARWQLGDRVLVDTGSPLMRGDDVSALQERMVKLGVHAGPVDGIFGPVTAASLRELQRGLGVPADGIFGPRTVHAMAALGRAVEGGDPWSLRTREGVAAAGKSLKGKVICLDAAHGGNGYGMSGHGLVEADVTAEVCRVVAEKLRLAGATVGLTRTGEPGDYPDIVERVDFATELGADLVVSFHCEANPSPLAEGFATFYWGGGRVGQHSAVGRALAGFVQREVVARTGVVDCRSHPCSYDLVRMTAMPAVMVGLGYLSNADDAQRLSSAAFLDAVADAVLAAVQRVYLGEDDATATGTIALADVLAHAEGN